MAQALEAAAERLDRAEGRVVLDFSGARRTDAGGLKALEEFAKKADDRGVKVELHGVDARVYKVLKLMKQASRFSFSN